MLCITEVRQTHSCIAELPTVIRNDDVDWPSLSQRIAAGEWHNVVISPGPGTPARETDVGECCRLLPPPPPPAWRL